MLCLFLHIDHLKIADIAKTLGLKDSRSAKKWLDDNGVPITKIGGKNVVSQFAFEFKRQQLEVEGLRISYPNKWFEIYDANTPNKAIVKSIRELYPETSVTKKISNKSIKQFIT